MQAVAQMPDCWRLAGSAHWIEHSKGTASADVTLANSQRSSGCVNLRPNPGEMSLRCHTAFQSRKHLPVLDSDLSRERSSSSIANEATSSSQLQRRRPFLRARPKSQNIFWLLHSTTSLLSQRFTVTQPFIRYVSALQTRIGSLDGRAHHKSIITSPL